MEHLISCVPGVEIAMSKKGVKVIHFQENKDPPGAGQLLFFSSLFFSLLVSLSVEFFWFFLTALLLLLFLHIWCVINSLLLCGRPIRSM